MTDPEKEKPDLCGGFSGWFFKMCFVLFCVYMWYLTLSNSLDSFLFSSVSRTLSLSYFCLYSVSNSSRSLWLQRRESTGLWNFLYCINFDIHFNKYPLISHSASVKKSPIYPTFVRVWAWAPHVFKNLNQRLGTKTRYTLFSSNTLMQLESDTALCLKMN